MSIITLTDHYNDVVSLLAKEIKFFSPQLFSVKNHKSTLPPSADSTALLIEVSGRHFLVTASHVIHEENLNNLGVMIGNDFCSIGGNWRYFEPNDLDACDPNKVDMAVVELDEETIATFKEVYQFLPWHKVGLLHKSQTGSPYLVYGYPESRTAKNFPTKKILPRAFVFRTTGHNEDYYRSEKIDTNKTIVLRTPHDGIRNVGGLNVELPDLGGISGGGVWHIYDLLEPEPKYELISFITGENESRTVLYSSRVDTLKRILAESFDVEFP